MKSPIERTESQLETKISGIGKMPLSEENTTKIDSVQKFIEVIKKQVGDNLKDGRDHLHFYRGQPNSTWHAQAGIFRDEDFESREKEITLEVISREAEIFSKDTNMFDCLARAQHFGAPTRLLDITRSPLIALYFACSDESHIEKNGRIFSYKISSKKLKYFNSDRVSILANLATLSEDEKNALKGKKTPEDKDKALKNLKGAILNEKQGFHLEIDQEILTSPLLLLPKQNNERLIAQQGAFILFGLYDDIPTHSISIKDDLIILANKKQDILDELEILGIHRQSVYSGIDHCAAYLKENMKRLEKEADKGDVASQKKLAKKLYQKGKYEKAIKYYQLADKQHDADAQFNLGIIYYNGFGIQKDLKKAREYFQKAASQGHAEAQFNLGLIYYNGGGIKQDFSKARKYFQKAADQGLPSAQFNLAIMYHEEEGGERNLPKAREYFQKAADQRDAGAQYNLALMYYRGEGEGEEEDLLKARKYFTKAADQGFASAQFNLALMYLKGEGGEKDLTKAREYFQKAADQGHAKAQYNLALMYNNGDGGEKDPTKVREYFEKAAEQGHEKAIEALKKLDEAEKKKTDSKSDKASKGNEEDIKKPKGAEKDKKKGSSEGDEADKGKG